MKKSITTQISDLKEILTKYGFTEFSDSKGKTKKHTFLFNVYFPNTMCTMYVYESKENAENLLIECINQPKWINPIVVACAEFEQFVKEMMLPGLQLQPLALEAWTSWNRPRTKGLLGPNNNVVTHGLFYIGYNEFDFYSELNTFFICNPLLQSVCVNEAGEEDSVWGAAQFRTAYSASFLNYEAITHSENQMIFYVSYSYVPSSFGLLSLQNTILKCPLHHYPQDMPADLVMAIEALCIRTQMSVDDMIEHIENKGVDSVFYTYVILFSRDLDEFFKKLPRIIRNQNPDVLAYLQTYFDNLQNPVYSAKFEEFKI